MNHLVVAEIQVFVDHNIFDVDLRNILECDISKNMYCCFTLFQNVILPIFLRSALLMLVFDIDDIFYG